jgi:hypothetical protein
MPEERSRSRSARLTAERALVNIVRHYGVLPNLYFSEVWFQICFARVAQ